MDDQQGNVIDGTVRARQWRPAKSKTRSAEARSDAPKSIAGSLLVPADMLPAAFLSPGDASGDERRSVIERPERAAGVTADGPGGEAAIHRNPFLVPEAGTLGTTRWTDRRIDWRPTRMSRRLAALVVVTLAFAGLLVTLIEDIPSTRSNSGASVATVSTGAALPAAIGGATSASATRLGVALKDLTHVVRRKTSARRVVRAHRSDRPRRRTITQPTRAVSGTSPTAPSVSTTSTYTAPAASSTTPLVSTQAAQPTAVPHRTPPPGPTGSDPLGGIGSCVKGC